MKYIKIAEQLVVTKKKHEKKNNKEILHLDNHQVLQKLTVQNCRFLSFIDINYLDSDTTHISRKQQKTKRVNSFCPLQGYTFKH